MKLISVRIENFKSIRDSSTFGIDEKVTCLVGKNESGKTATLQAITKLNSTDPETSKFDELEYPRHLLNDYKKTSEYAGCLTTKWRLEESDFVTLESILGPTVRADSEITISKGYSNTFSNVFSLEETDVIKHVLSNSGLLTDEQRGLDKASDIPALIARLRP